LSEQFESVALTSEHDVGAFDCGVASLNAWLTDQSLRAQEAGTARTFVWVTADAPERVWAYFSLAPTEVARIDLSRGQSSGVSVVPGYLLARLTVHQDLRGSGHGAELLVDALSRAARAAELGGGRLVVVDAIDDHAASFYRYHGFVPVKSNPNRLVLKIASVHALLD
jgi:predicted GNAT family N-acyltransferase